MTGYYDTPALGKQKKGKGAPTKKKRRREKMDKGYIAIPEPKRVRAEVKSADNSNLRIRHPS